MVHTNFYPKIEGRSLELMKSAKTNICKKCGNEFKVNDDIHSRISGGHTKLTKNYHLECWKKMLY